MAVRRYFKRNARFDYNVERKESSVKKRAAKRMKLFLFYQPVVLSFGPGSLKNLGILVKNARETNALHACISSYRTSLSRTFQYEK